MPTPPRTPTPSPQPTAGSPRRQARQALARSARRWQASLALITATGLAWLIAGTAPLAADTERPQPLLVTKPVTSETEGHAVAIDVEIPADSRDLFLVVDDAGDGFACDWANWLNPVLVAADGGETSLLDLEWESATAAWGSVRRNQNCNGGPLKVLGETYETGIGTHANSVIHFRLPEGVRRFQALAALDDGGTTQNAGHRASVRFAVFDQRPHPDALAGAAPPVDPDHVRDSRRAEHAVYQLDVADGLEVTLFASEPMLVSPSAIDVDHRGRVWVCEVVNYRRHAGNRPEGDRILILEDTTGDGIADKKTVFYQGTDIDSPHGVCVLGNRVLVSALDKIIVLIDDTGDDKADRKEILFSNTGSVQHDHGIHTAMFGPDGRLYFNFGDHARRLGDADGETITDLAGNLIQTDGNPYRMGMVFRSEVDGSRVESLAWNFRNNWEVAVDSFGSLWQSDNDDDGNASVRINYVMEFGNYGYTDEITGAGWRTDRVNLEEEVFQRHWHQNDPGVVPNVVDTGSGSPTGILVYEGDLLPEPYQNQIIHAEPGHNVVRLHPVEADGAGYTGTIEPVVTGARDRWFRPTGVRTAPDGSIVFADWYDPGVGGHNKGDAERGRIFILAPEGHRYHAPEFDFDTLDGALQALRNPNNAVRHLAWNAIRDHGADAEKALADIFTNEDENPRYRARALWLLGHIEGRGSHWVDQALQSDHPDLRITGLRMARQHDFEVMSRVEQVLEDPDPRVRREAAVALRFSGSVHADRIWTALARQHDGRDRWYLEALGIGADLHWNSRWKVLNELEDDKKPSDEAWLDLLWRSRADAAAPLLAEAAIEHPDHGLRMLRALHFQPGGEAVADAYVRVAAEGRPDVALQAALLADPGRLADSPAADRLPELAAAAVGSPDLVRLVERHQLDDLEPALLAFALEQPNHQEAVNAVRQLLDNGDHLDTALTDDDQRSALIGLLGRTGDQRATAMLAGLMTDDDLDDEHRRAAVGALGLNRAGEERLLELAREERVPEGLSVTVASLLGRSRHEDIREAAAGAITIEAPGMENLPPVADLLAMEGRPGEGRAAFEKATCATCHVVRDEGINFGPDLSQIGGKLPREAMLEAILYPNAGISHGYQGRVVKTDEGALFTGFVASETDDELVLRMPGGIDQAIASDKIEEVTELEASLMPPGLLALLTPQEIADLLAYLDELK